MLARSQQRIVPAYDKSLIQRRRDTNVVENDVEVVRDQTVTRPLREECDG